ncbi:transcriptional repressor NrdR [Candidatus Saccharibacteria bacterium]|nr:transcriptional repressor NrdR [Candidatus Saccharibacteria bacterium]
MKCRKCHKTETKVIESRDVADGDAIRRRRECLDCSYRFTTYERVERPQLIIVKNNGTREMFSREKLLAGLYRACEKTSITNVQLEKIAADVENSLYNCSDPEVPTSKIGSMVMDQLGALDEVAYVRFASVYRRFKDIAGFEKELSRIRKIKSDRIKK